MCNRSTMWSKLSFTAFVLLIGASCSQREAQVRACTPPLATWRKPHPHLGPDIPTFTVSLDRNGAVYLNGKALSFNNLASQLKPIGDYETPQPAVILETEMGAPCASLDSVRSLMNERLDCEHGGHCDEGVQAVWRELPSNGAGVP